MGWQKESTGLTRPQVAAILSTAQMKQWVTTKYTYFYNDIKIIYEFIPTNAENEQKIRNSLKNVKRIETRKN